DAVGKAGVVVDAFGDPGISAEGAAFDDQRVDTFAGGVDRCRKPCRPAADDDEVVEGALRPELEPELVRQLVVAGFKQVAAIREDDRRDRAAAVLELFDEAACGFVLVDVDPLIVDPLFAEELLRTAAVSAPWRSVHQD